MSNQVRKYIHTSSSILILDVSIYFGVEVLYRGGFYIGRTSSSVLTEGCIRKGNASRMQVPGRLRSRSGSCMEYLCAKCYILLETGACTPPGLSEGERASSQAEVGKRKKCEPEQISECIVPSDPKEPKTIFLSWFIKGLECHKLRKYVKIHEEKYKHFNLIKSRD